MVVTRANYSHNNEHVLSIMHPAEVTADTMWSQCGSALPAFFVMSGRRRLHVLLERSPSVWKRKVLLTLFVRADAHVTHVSTRMYFSGAPLICAGYRARAHRLFSFRPDRWFLISVSMCVSLTLLVFCVHGGVFTSKTHARGLKRVSCADLLLKVWGRKSLSESFHTCCSRMACEGNGMSGEL